MDLLVIASASVPYHLGVAAGAGTVGLRLAAGPGSGLVGSAAVMAGLFHFVDVQRGTASALPGHAIGVALSVHVTVLV